MSAPSKRSETFATFDVVVVPFPYADRLAEKRRPAIVISTPALAQHGLVWLAMITSAENRHWDSDISVSDLKLAGLPAPSLVRPAKIATIDSERVLRRIGKLPAKDARAVAVQLKEFMA